MSDQFDDADAAFDRDIPEHLREDVMTMICEAAQGWSEHEAVTILERDRLDAINVRAHGIVTVGDDEFTFIVEDGNRNGTRLEDWNGNKPFEVLERTVWALQPKDDLVSKAIISGKGPFLIMKWDAILRNLPEVAAIPGKYAYDRYVQPGGQVEKHWKAEAAKHHFAIVTKETADATRARLAEAVEDHQP